MLFNAWLSVVVQQWFYRVQALSSVMFFTIEWHVQLAMHVIERPYMSAAV
jgi:hypothetical protein